MGLGWIFSERGILIVDVRDGRGILGVFGILMGLGQILREIFSQRSPIRLIGLGGGHWFVDVTWGAGVLVDCVTARDER